MLVHTCTYTRSDHKLINRHAANKMPVRESNNIVCAQMLV